MSTKINKNVGGQVADVGAWEGESVKGVERESVGEWEREREGVTNGNRVTETCVAW
jgi:hypothetical protein